MVVHGHLFPQQWATILICLFFPAIIRPILAQELSTGPSSMLDSVQCRLDTGRTLTVQYSFFLQTYVEVNPFVSSLLGDDYYSDENPVMEVRVCWCSQYFNRRYEYCPANFDLCQVDGFDGPVTCFYDNQGSTFVRGFWFICIFWFLALLYAFTCTEQGSSARSFVKRKLWSNLQQCCCCCRAGNSNSNVSDSAAQREREMLSEEVERMIRREPDRATWLLRSAFLRERNRLQRSQRRFFGLVGPATTTSTNNNNNNDDTNAAVNGTTNTTSTTHSNNNDAGDSLSPWQQKMELKVKKYNGSSTPTTSSSNNDETTPASSAKEDDHSANHAVGGEQEISSFSFAHASQILSSALSSLSVEVSTAGISGNGDALRHGGEHEDEKCAICLSTVEIGDRIGDIPCGHIYCIECLKDWLKRKNHCPLCLRGGLATPVSSPSSATERSNAMSEDSQDDVEQGNRAGGRRGGSLVSGRSSERGLIVSMPANLPTRTGRRSRS